MGKIYFIADAHFGDDNIRRYEKRPFNSVKEMDEKLIQSWNSVVGQDDFVYVLGDFGANGNESNILSLLNGTKYLIRGNHDVSTNEYYRNAGFSEVYDCSIIIENFWILSHEPLYINSNMPYANIFGHVHNSPIIKDFSSQHFCVSAERINYTPVNFDDIKYKIKNAT